MSRTLRAQDAHWIWHIGTFEAKDRRAVLMELDSADAVVMYGYSKAHGYPGEFGIKPGSNAGRKMGLKHLTHFSEESMDKIGHSDVKNRIDEVPSLFFTQLQKLIVAIRAKKGATYLAVRAANAQQQLGSGGGNQQGQPVMSPVSMSPDPDGKD